MNMILNFVQNLDKCLECYYNTDNTEVNNSDRKIKFDGV